MDTVIAVVQKVFAQGPHGPYVVATTETLGSVTFSLEPTVWQEEDFPEAGNVVLLSKIRRKRAGWRAKAGRYYVPSDEQRAKEKPMTEIATKKMFMDAIREFLATMIMSQITKATLEKLDALLKQAASGIGGFVTHWDIEISGAQNFFYQASSSLLDWEKEKVFADRNVLKVVTQQVLEHYLTNERARKFGFEDLGNGRINYHPDKHHISWCETTAADLLRDLGFFVDAAALYQRAIQTAGDYYKGAAEHAYEHQRTLLKAYRLSGQQIPVLDQIDIRLQGEIVKSAQKVAVHNIGHLIKWTEAMYWDRPLKAAHKILEEMGHADEKNRDRILKPAYEASVENLIHDRELIIAKGKEKPEQCSWRCDSIIEMYQRLGNEEKAKEWQRTDLRAHQLHIVESIVDCERCIKVCADKKSLQEEWQGRLQRNLEQLAKVSLELTKLDGYDFSKA